MKINSIILEHLISEDKRDVLPVLEEVLRKCDNSCQVLDGPETCEVDRFVPGLLAELPTDLLFVESHGGDSRWLADLHRSPLHHSIAIDFPVSRLLIENYQTPYQLLEVHDLICWELTVFVPELQQLDLQGNSIPELYVDILRIHSNSHQSFTGMPDLNLTPEFHEVVLPTCPRSSEARTSVVAMPVLLATSSGTFVRVREILPQPVFEDDP